MVMASEVESEADVFRGCTSTELITIIVVSILFWAPLMATLGVVLLGSMMMGLGMVVIQRFLGKHRIRKSGFFLHHGELSLGRSRGSE